VRQDVFVSYSQADKAAADRICEVLEQNEIGCWMAPRNIPAGVTWANSIVSAIGTCRVMALICSSHSIGSRQVSRELELADAHKLPIVPVRLEDAPLSGDMLYFLGNTQWFDAFPGSVDDHVERLVRAIRDLLQSQQVEDKPASAPPVQMPVAAPSPKVLPSPSAPLSALPVLRSRRAAGVVAVVAAILVVAGIMFWLVRGKAPTPGHPFAPFEGTWQLSVLEGTAISRLAIRGDSELLVHAWKNCADPQCDLGERPAKLSGGSAQVTFTDADGSSHDMTLRPDSPGKLSVQIYFRDPAQGRGRTFNRTFLRTPER
jgi:hypothetical protein